MKAILKDGRVLDVVLGKGCGVLCTDGATEYIYTLGKVIDKIKNWFKRKPRFEERYTLNKMYQDNAELKRFIQERQKTVMFEWNEFPADQYGKAELIRNNKVIESAKLMKGKYDLIYWKFDE